MSIDLDKLTITVTDIKKAGICLGQGARPFFAARGVEWSDFMRTGVTARWLWDTGDGYARLIVTRKLMREGLSDG